MATTATPSTWDRFKAQSWTAIGLEIAGAFLLLAFVLTVMSGGEPIDPPAASSGSPAGAAVDPSSLSGLLDAYLPFGVVVGLLVWAYAGWQKWDKAVFRGIATGAGATLALVVFSGGSTFLQETLDTWSLGTADTTFPLLAALVAAWFGYTHENKDSLVKAFLAGGSAWMLTAHGTTILNEKIPAFFGGFGEIQLTEAMVVAALVGSGAHLTWEKTSRSIMAAMAGGAGTIVLLSLPEYLRDAFTPLIGSAGGISLVSSVFHSSVTWLIAVVALLIALFGLRGSTNENFVMGKALSEVGLVILLAIAASFLYATWGATADLSRMYGFDEGAGKWLFIRYTAWAYLPHYIATFLLVFAVWPMPTSKEKALALIGFALIGSPLLYGIIVKYVWAGLRADTFADILFVFTISVTLLGRLVVRNPNVTHAELSPFGKFLAGVILFLTVAYPVFILMAPSGTMDRMIIKIWTETTGLGDTIGKLSDNQTDQIDLGARRAGVATTKTKAFASAEIGDISDSPAAERLARARALTEPDAAAADFQVGWFHDLLCTHVHDNRPGCRTPEKAAELRAIIKDEARIIQHNTPEGLRKEVADIGTAWWRSIFPGDDVKHLVTGSATVNSVIHVPLGHKVFFIGPSAAEFEEKLTTWPSTDDCQWVTLADIADLDVLAMPMRSDLPTPNGTEGRHWTPREC